MKLYVTSISSMALLGILLICFSNSGKAQGITDNSGLTLELGAGYNQLLWQATDFTGTSEANRTKFSIMPTARLGYLFPISTNIGLHPFAGYNEFGGHDELHNLSPDPTNPFFYKDQFRFQNIEAGIFGFYKVGEFRLGVGSKVNRHLKITQRYYWENNNGNPDGWHTNENPQSLQDWSMDAGIKTEYETAIGILIGAEGWFGLSNLAKQKYEESVQMKIRQNHFRIIVGYRL